MFSSQKQIVGGSRYYARILLLKIFSVLSFWVAEWKQSTNGLFAFCFNDVFICLIFQTTYVLEAEEGNPDAIAVHPSGDDFVCAFSSGNCK